MKLYKIVLQQINANRERRLKGEAVTIPWSLPRLSAVLPGIERGRYVLVSAPPKGGKTQFTDFLFVYEPIEWMMKNPNSGIKLKIFYFSLEMSKLAKIRAAISYKLFKDRRFVISPSKLMSVFEKYILDIKIKNIIESDDFTEWLDKFEDYVEFHDEIRNPFGIFNLVRNFAEANGTYTTKKFNTKDEHGNVKEVEVNDIYTPNDPNLFVIVIVDHISLLKPEEGASLHQTISKFSSTYALYMRDKWGFIPVIVQQQSAESANAEVAKNTGKLIINKIKPSPEGLADNKYTARDVDLMLSLFDPSRYDIQTYGAYELPRMFGNHRELNVNLNRNGISNVSVQLYFNGAASHFEELPKEPTEALYKDIDTIERNTI